MPYVPSLKTDGKSDDRVRLDVVAEEIAQELAKRARTNFGLLQEYKQQFISIGSDLALLAKSDSPEKYEGTANKLAYTIFDVARKYQYEGAFLGELNYSITRLIQRVPQIKVELGQWLPKDELRYWLYAATVEALTYAANYFEQTGIGVAGVFEDIKDEYKRRVNVGYEAAQIVKSGDCYDTPYYTRLVEVVDEEGKLIGHQEIMLKRDTSTLNVDVLPGQFVLVRTKVVQA
jgi:hypothetical protein